MKPVSEISKLGFEYIYTFIHLYIYTFENCSFEFGGNNLKTTKPHFRRSKIAFLGVFKLSFNLVKINVVSRLYIFRCEYVFFLVINMTYLLLIRKYIDNKNKIRIGKTLRNYHVAWY